jgi:GNAT superfamily N-acetyltransferase
MDQHPLGILLSRAVAGHWPAADGQIEVFPALPNGEAAVLGFTGHFVIAADVDPSWVRSRLPDDDLCAPMGPRFLHALALELRKQPGSLDLVFWASAEEGPLPVELRLTPDRSHARARRAECHRDELRVYQTPDASGVLVLGRGVCGRWEASFEVAPEHRRRGLGRALAASARRLVEPGAPVFMQAAVANTASVRAILHGGFAPLCAEVLYG